MIFWVSALVAFIVSILRKYLILNLPDVVYISNTGASNIKIISEEIFLFLSFNIILQKIGCLFLVLALISTGIYIYQRYYNT